MCELALIGELGECTQEADARWQVKGAERRHHSNVATKLRLILELPRTTLLTLFESLPSQIVLHSSSSWLLSYKLITHCINMDSVLLV